ncbi:MAG: hypothetical protein JW782_01345 [Candidatus Saganbacteria bacterium]|nr:hypothetical protein [Candidatus Saganbacteria bacterium]
MIYSSYSQISPCFTLLRRASRLVSGETRYLKGLNHFAGLLGESLRIDMERQSRVRFSEIKAGFPAITRAIEEKGVSEIHFFLKNDTFLPGPSQLDRLILDSFKAGLRELATYGRPAPAAQCLFFDHGDTEQVLESELTITSSEGQNVAMSVRVRSLPYPRIYGGY